MLYSFIISKLFTKFLKFSLEMNRMFNKNLKIQLSGKKWEIKMLVLFP